MKPITVVLLALAVTAALPLAAQQTPPTETTEATETSAEATAETEIEAATNDAAQTDAVETEAAASTDATIDASADAQQQPAAPPTAPPPPTAPAPAAGEMSAEQQAMMQAWQKASTPGAQHQQLIEQFVGEWDTKMTMWMEPSAPPTVETGTTTNTAVHDDRRVRMEYRGQFMGQPFEGVGYSGYDNVTGKYYSSWMDNTSTGLHVSQGNYDAASQTYTYTSDMPDMMKPGSTVPVREVVTVTDADHHVMEWYETRDGKEQRMMQIEFSRAE